MFVISLLVCIRTREKVGRRKEPSEVKSDQAWIWLRRLGSVWSRMLLCLGQSLRQQNGESEKKPNEGMTQVPQSQSRQITGHGRPQEFFWRGAGGIFSG